MKEPQCCGSFSRKNSIFATEEQIQAVREQLGLDAPFHERYFDYITGVATGDLGTAITNRQPVIENIKAALPVTCTVIVMAMAWVILFTVILSAISVIRYHWNLRPKFLAGPYSFDGFRSEHSDFSCHCRWQHKIADTTLNRYGSANHLYIDKSATRLCSK